eukprot:CAMPEP_0113728960 /NCGR_PEP_ID=MMETSP0038_2-20120614/42243_1 /TAXON_ID=2898 /ORGANISM="Cryptomonas paramecium" /LENGTH=65 /DNA_ID=CAMNT_0000660667 /DNA_START=1 /DNA_END=194 /DNA_ORIENTATION=+ /assembly_acc=CAM_ASM_000170
MKDCADDRRLSLSSACEARGVHSVLRRLQFLRQAWIGTPKFVEAIEEDLQYVKSVQESLPTPAIP